MRTQASILLLVAISFGVTVSTPSSPQQARSPSGLVAQVERDGFRFPERIAAFRKAGFKDYSKAGPGLGFSFQYTGPGSADIYVYDRGQDLRAKGADPAIEREIALNEVRAAAERGLYEAMDLLDRSVHPRLVAGHYVSTAAVRIHFRGQSLDSYIFVTVIKGRYVKLRYSAPSGPSTRQEAEILLSQFLASQQ